MLNGSYENDVNNLQLARGLGNEAQVREARHVKISEPLDEHEDDCPTVASSYISSQNDDCVCRLPNHVSSTPPHAFRARRRTMSGSKSEDHLITTESGRRVYTKGRPPWYDREGKNLKQPPYVIGICGGSASGKTTVARRIIERLEIPWVTVLSMDSFYKILTKEDHELAAKQEYNFDHPDVFDFGLLCETIRRLREGKSVEVPVYDFSTHRRDKQPKIMYGADVVIFEGILAFHSKELVELMDMKVFVDTDADTRLARRLQRDVEERGRDVEGVLAQYFRFVKPAFDLFIAPGMKEADIIVPRGGENEVAIDLIVKQVKKQLDKRGYDASKNLNLLRADMAMMDFPPVFPNSITIVPQTPQVLGLHTFIRNKNTSRDEFVFYADRLMKILIENAMNLMDYEDVSVETSNGELFAGKRKTSEICGVSIMRAGETMENALRAVVKDCKMGKILIQTNEKTMEPELYYIRLPKNVEHYRVILMDATVATGAAAMMAIRILLDHDVLEENIFLLSLLMAESGVHSLAYAFPKVRLLTTAVDSGLNRNFYVIPGLGNFGDRYFGTEVTALPNDVSNQKVYDNSTLRMKN